MMSSRLYAHCTHPRLARRGSGRDEVLWREDQLRLTALRGEDLPKSSSSASSAQGLYGSVKTA